MRNRLQGIVCCLLVIVLLAGCAGWKKKFIRKRKTPPKPPQAILTLEPDHKALLPAADRYREHYAFWKSWHADLLNFYGQTQKRDVAYLTGAIGELRAMQRVLKGTPADSLSKILAELTEMEQQWRDSSGAWSPSATTRTRLEQLQREVQKKFHYSEVKDFIAEE